ncbi:MAG: MFS transporter [Gammaproteobacteria bacterium]|nr:MFS transporter [Gammaproteobacteria bacterium]NIR82356.1 MFS transporter [Gammaproteobacteria bacterium]NIR91951.1 MFS transporter [Gammaproteobacteria bacterium]NIV76979.1 MFS transporter [Gammaproteobacteria bacterium]
MNVAGKATRIELFNPRSPQMRAFHMTWFAFFLAFFGWFGIAPLMPLVREDLGLTKEQIGNTIIASVAITVLVRVLIGKLCDTLGPRLTYSGLLMIGSIPVMAIGLADDYESFLLFRLAIGAIGASFVITQYHTSVMFAPNVVGTANATTAGWGNLGGGVTQMVMPLILAAVLMLGVEEALGWRLAMTVPGVALFLTGIAYYFFTQDAPEGDYRTLRAAGKLPPASNGGVGSFKAAARDYRVWLLFVIYGACFGVELTINNIAAIYYFDYFSLDLKTAGLIAGLFGLMNLFARTLGGVFSDRAACRWGLRGRVGFLLVALLMEGVALVVFSQMSVLLLAVGTMVVFSLFVQMSEGATYGLVPFINRNALGPVAGIVGAGGNAGAVAAGFLFRSESLSMPEGLLVLGLVVMGISGLALFVRFSPVTVAEEKAALETSLAERARLADSPA